MICRVLRLSWLVWLGIGRSVTVPLFGYAVIIIVGRYLPRKTYKMIVLILIGISYFSWHFTIVPGRPTSDIHHTIIEKDFNGRGGDRREDPERAYLFLVRTCMRTSGQPLRYENNHTAVF